MIGISSSSAGVLFLPKTESDEYTILDLVEGVVKKPEEAQHLYSVSQDWEEIEGNTTEELLEIATSEYWLKQTVSYLRLAIGELEESLEIRVLEQVEEALSTRVNSENVINRLLVAPLINPSTTVTLAQSALSKGFAATASILDELAELQPLIRRFTDLWLDLPETAFSSFPESKEMIWLTAVDKCGISQLLNAKNNNDFNSVWNRLFFHFTSPKSIAGLNAIGKCLSKRLYPDDKEIVIIPPNIKKSIDQKHCEQKSHVRISHREYKRVEKEIDSITKAVSEGNDAKATKFLKELIKKQTFMAGGENYAVKSLCNIAQRCADMFRMDFEEFCLNEALNIHPTDPWMLIQYGDHLKRVGNYEKALEILKQAENLGDGIAAKISIADVFSLQGNYEDAIHTYNAIPNFHENSVVLTAIADNYRKMGRLDQSEAKYSEIIELSQQGLFGFTNCEVRAFAGIAEIKKRQGNLEIAKQTYQNIVTQDNIDEKDLTIYKLGLCYVLKLMEHFNEAYVLVDEIIQKHPFSMQARFTRGSILGLIGKEQEGLDDLPESKGDLSWREWVRPYYRGLLLFKLKRYDEAKINLINELSKAITYGEEKAILRMAAALYYLEKDEIHEVDGILSEINSLNDCHAQYLSLVLKLHSATKKDNIETINYLKDQIAKLKVDDPTLDKAVEALEKKDYFLALSYETDSFLKHAA